LNKEPNETRTNLIE